MTQSLKSAQGALKAARRRSSRLWRELEQHGFAGKHKTSLAAAHAAAHAITLERADAVVKLGIAASEKELKRRRKQRMRQPAKSVHAQAAAPRLTHRLTLKRESKEQLS